MLATRHLGLGGTESYLLTVAEQLQRLGHVVTIEAEELGRGGQVARGRGLRVAGLDGCEAPGHCDAVIANDAGGAYACAQRWPAAPQMFVAHNEMLDAQLPPQLSGLISSVVVLNGRVERRVGALAADFDVVRLRQPIDTERFAGREIIRDRPRRALVLSNYVRGARLSLLRRAWEPEGVDCVVAGMATEQSESPELDIADADIVVGKSRALLEGMAAGRAAYVFDFAGCDGWVTPAAYPELESDGFAGQTTPQSASIESLRADLTRYRPEMGVQNRDLVLAHHGARAHAERLVKLLKAMAPGNGTDPAALPELQRLLATQWRLEGRTADLARDNEGLHERVLELERSHEELRATRRYRLAAALGSPADRLRRLRP